MNEKELKQIDLIDKYFNAANYVSAAQLYLLDNPLLKRKLKKSDIKSKIVGHWGTVPAQNFIYAHLNRAINDFDLNMIYISGPGHGGNSVVSNTYLEGTYSEIYPNITYDEKGLQKLFKQFSFPGGVSSHAAPETPGSIHEGGELGYSLAHAFGAVLDNPDLIAACVIGDGEAETGPLATSWHGTKFINPKTDGVVLPILNLNGYKISNPTVFSRISNAELGNFFFGCGWKPYLVEGDNPKEVHKIMYQTLNKVINDIKEIKQNAKEGKIEKRPFWPMIILKTPKGWTGPKEVDGNKVEGTFKAHQVPISMEKEEHLKMLEDWLKSYHPEKLFDKNGSLNQEIRDFLPKGNKRMGINPHTNGGLLLKDLNLPDFKKYAVTFDKRGTYKTMDMFELSNYIKGVYESNKNNFRIFTPDEAMSNRLYKIFEVENRDWQSFKKENDEYLNQNGRIMDSYLSEHMCEGMLEGYLLTGRHGIFSSYEAFIRVVDSMIAQHAKWLKICNEISWRRDISSLNLLLTSHAWQQDHNGYTHQDPGILNHLASKKSTVTRMYLPPDANSLIFTFNHLLKSKNHVNVVVASKHPSYQWLSMDEAIVHCTKGIGVWSWASNDENEDPDIIMACCGDTPTLETLAAISILKEYLPQIKIRCINVVDLMKLKANHPHGLSDEEYDMLFTKDKPIIFAFHGYPDLIYSLTYKRNNRNMHVHGYIEEGTITTPFDMRVQNKIDRYHLVKDAIIHLPNLGSKGTHLIEEMENQIIKHNNYIKEKGTDLKEVKDWQWK